MEWHGMAWDDIEWHELAWDDIKWDRMALDGLVWQPTRLDIQKESTEILCLLKSLYIVCLIL